MGDDAVFRIHLRRDFVALAARLPALRLKFHDLGVKLVGVPFADHRYLTHCRSSFTPTNVPQKEEGPGRIRGHRRTPNYALWRLHMFPPQQLLPSLLAILSLPQQAAPSLQHA